MSAKVFIDKQTNLSKCFGEFLCRIFFGKSLSVYVDLYAEQKLVYFSILYTLQYAKIEFSQLKLLVLIFDMREASLDPHLNLVVQLH